jgi:hypothetical protein
MVWRKRFTRPASSGATSILKQLVHSVELARIPAASTIVHIHERHLTPQHIDELRKHFDSGLLKKMTHSREATPALTTCIPLRGSKPEHINPAATPAYPDAADHDRPGGFEPDR